MATYLALPFLPPEEALLFSLVTGTGIFFVLAAVFTPLLSMGNDLIASLRGRVFHTRAAQQAAQMGLLLYTTLLIVSGFGAYTFFQDPVSQWPLLYQTVAVTIAGSAGLSWLCQAGRAFSGNKAGTIWRCLLSSVGAITAIIALYSLACLILHLTHMPAEANTGIDAVALTDPVHELLQFLAIPPRSLFWPVLLQGAALGICTSAGLLIIWLFLVRQRQDFGRDYYTFTLRHFCRWALLSGVHCIGFGVYATWTALTYITLPELSQMPSTPLLAATVVAPVLSCVAWFLASQSHTPLRHKVSLCLACLFLYGAILGQVLIFNKIIPSP